MSIKFKVNSRSHGYRVRQEIFDFEYNVATHITLAGVKNILHLDIDEDDMNYSWDVKELKRDKEIRVRALKDEQWYIYLPDPEYTPIEETSLDQETIEFVNYLGAMMVDIMKEQQRPKYRPIEVMKKVKKNEYQSETGYFHGWTTNRIVKPDGTIVDDLLAIVEFPDGHIERNKFDKVCFLDCEIAETKFE